MTATEIDERKKDAAEIAELLSSLSSEETKEECRKAIRWLIAGVNLRDAADKTA